MTNVQSNKAEISRTNRTDTDQAYLSYEISLLLREGKKSTIDNYPLNHPVCYAMSYYIRIIKRLFIWNLKQQIDLGNIVSL